MNRGEAMGLGFIASAASITTYYLILYLAIFDNLLVVSLQLGSDLYPVKSEMWWLLIGFGFILGLRTITKVYKWARRDFCNHCGKELSK